MAGSSPFNHQLGRVVGRFAERTDADYRLVGTGPRVVEGVLSGAVTNRPSLERMVVEEPCPYCGAPVAIEWEKGGAGPFDSACTGRYDRTRPSHVDEDEDDCGGDAGVEV